MAKFIAQIDFVQVPYSVVRDRHQSVTNADNLELNSKKNEATCSG